MTHRIALAGLVLTLASGPALAQASVDVTAGNLHGSAQAGALQRQAPSQRLAKGPRTDDCNSRGVTVRSGNGSSSASASVSTSPGGSSVVAGGGSPGSRTEYFGCNRPDHPQNDNRSQR